MALEYVGGTSGAGTSSGYTVSLTGLTGGIASAPAEGDLVVVFSGFANTASSAPNVSGNNSGAYLAATAAQHVNDTWDTEFRSFYKVMGATPDTSLTITRATNTAYGGATTVQVWRGVDQANPFINAATSTTGGNGAALNSPGYDPAVADSIIISGGMGTMPSAGTAGYTGISGMSNVVTGYGNGSTADASVIMASYAYVGAFFDPPAATGGTQNNTSSSWAGVTIAFRPAPTYTIHDAGVDESTASGEASAAGAGFDLSASESITAIDDRDASIVRTGDATEPGAAADVAAAAIEGWVQVLEASGAADAASGDAAFQVSLAEPVTATDAALAGGVNSVDIAETSSAAEDQTVTRAIAAPASETLDALDFESAAFTGMASAAEPVSAADAAVSSQAGSTAINEAGAGSDSVGSWADRQAAATEAETASDAGAAAGAHLAYSLETGAAVDDVGISSASLQSSIAEPVSAGDAVSTFAAAVNVVAEEGLSASDAVTTNRSVVASVSAPAVAADDSAAAAMYFAAVQAMVSALDDANGILVMSVGLDEAVPASDHLSVSAPSLQMAVIETSSVADDSGAWSTIDAALGEALAADDATSAVADLVAGVMDTSDARDFAGLLVGIYGLVTEALTASDRTGSIAPRLVARVVRVLATRSAAGAGDDRNPINGAGPVRRRERIITGSRTFKA